MTVSKRLRFEILRRDNHACYYCGRSAPQVQLTIDHVLPIALGGSDDPANLVAACQDCNSGKSSIPADAETVKAVAADAVRWASAMQQAAAIRASEIAAENETLDQFDAIWTKYWMQAKRHGKFQRVHAPRPPDWRRSVLQFIAAGLDISYLATTVRTCLYENESVDWDERWRYFCGFCWRELDARREIATSLLKLEDYE